MREEPAPHGRLVVRWDLIERDPTLGMADWPRPRRRQTYRLSASEVRLFPAEFCHVRLGPALGLVVGAGLRRAEICGLRWEDVNFEAGTVCPKRNVVPCSSEMGGGLQVCQTKTESSSAAVHVMPAVLGMLEAYHATCPDTRPALRRPGLTDVRRPGGLLSVSRELFVRLLGV